MSTSLKKFADEQDKMSLIYNGESFMHGDMHVISYSEYLENDQW